MYRLYGAGGVILVFMFLFILGLGRAEGKRYPAALAVEVVSDERGMLTRYPADFHTRNTRRSYVVARDEERYSIRVRNNSNHRIGLVIAVDGRNILSGKKSYLKSREKMYILEPYGVGTYSGWRTNRNRVHRFYFTGMSDSYAAAWGDTTAMGVIAVAAFKDRDRDAYRPPNSRKKQFPEQPKARGR